MEASLPKPKGPKPPIPLNVLTGFLGSGKTTLLNRLLKAPGMAETAVIINEFGEVGIDHLLVERADEGILELSSGCLCCTIRGDLINTLEDLLRRLDNGRISPFRRVVIETTGLADPAPVLHAVMSHPYLVLRYRLDGVIATVDAVNGMGTLDAHPEAVKQAAVADRLVLTKSDLCDTPERQARLSALRVRLHDLNPAAPILDAAKGEATPEALLDAGLFDPAKKIPDVAAWLKAEAYADAHRHDHDHHGRDERHRHGGTRPHRHAHDVNRHDDHIRAFAVATDAPIAAPALDMFLDLLRSVHGPQLLRLKGVVRLAEEPDRPLVIHGVQHVFHPPVLLDAWPDEDRRTRLVLITRDMEPAAVQRLLDAFTGAPRVDTPDRAAVADNPLAPSGRGGLLG